ncbi:conserved hypothetical protein [Trichinella spiralis]|uniref:hypothetical protein n=1 Tax=Trichinella spiralis TaxID=6334 RepID=UPI0001EFD839|nr:conserved hypothetical protein [Trichinella spiralis]
MNNQEQLFKKPKKTLSKEHIWNEYFNEEEKQLILCPIQRGGVQICIISGIDLLFCLVEKVCRGFGAVSLEQLLPSFAVRPWASLFHNKNESLRKSRQPSREW